MESATYASATPLVVSKVHKIFLKDQKLSPEHLDVAPGSIVEWIIDKSTEEQEFSLYLDGRRNHVIFFPALNIESPVLKPGCVFRVRFLQEGTFEYHCQIYTRLRGAVTVKAPLPALGLIPSTLLLQKPALADRSARVKERHALGNKLIEVLENEQDLALSQSPVMSKANFKELAERS